MKRIKSLSESPCYQCHYELECDEKIKRSPVLSQIRDEIFIILTLITIIVEFGLH